MSQSEVLTLPFKWNVPHRRNTFFTGREDILTRLHDTLTAGKTVALTQPQAISGLGGIGKTQTAVEYAYRYGNEYNAVLWAKADSREVLVSDFVNIADLLLLPEKSEQDQNHVVNAVKRWQQTSKNWLLILDNVEDLTMVSDFIPPASSGHILLTTRGQATGSIANNIEIEKMEPQEGALFLLRRAKLIEKASEKDRIKAKEISQEMDGLPLALDQAGAYIEETRCGLSRYFELYQARRAQLLNRRGNFATDHPESVTTTFSLAFEKVQQANAAAAELLKLCAFLYADDIPEEIISEGASELGVILQPVVADPFELNETIGELLKYSLVHRDDDKQTLSIHRLVQVVFKDGMDENIQRMWAERTVRATSLAFPVVEFATWAKCQRCLPHAQACSALIEQKGMKFIEAAVVVHRAGDYLYEHAQYFQAELLFMQAIAIKEHILGSYDPDVASSLNILALLYSDQGKYTQAEPLFMRARVIYERAFGPEDINVAMILSNLAALYGDQGKHELVESLYQRVLHILYIQEKIGKPNHVHLAVTLNNLAEYYRVQGIYTQAEQLIMQAIAINERILEPNHPHMAQSLNNLAIIYVEQGKYIQAEQLYQQLLNICEQIWGLEDPHVATSLNSLAGLYQRRGKYAIAESFYRQALTINEQKLGPDHPSTALNLDNLATLYFIQGNYTQAEPLIQRALNILERSLGPEHPHVAICLYNLTTLYIAQKKYSQAELYLRRTLIIKKKILGLNHPEIEVLRELHITLLQRMKQKDRPIPKSYINIKRSKPVKKSRKRR